MSRKTSSDFHPEVLRLFDKYVHGQISRRGFLDDAARFAVGGLTAAGLLEALSPRFAEAQQIAPSDSRLKTESIEITAPGYGKVRAYKAQPKDAKGKLPVVLVVHENRGLNPHIEDVTRRIALENYIAVAPDALFPLGGYPGNEDAARELFGKLDQNKTREDFVASAEYLKKLTEGNGKLGGVGFCYGGGMVNFLATRVPGLNAAVPFYGNAAPLEDVPKIKSPLLIQFAENDERINAAWPAYEAALKNTGVKYQAYTIRARSTDSTTIRHRATTKPRRNWHGVGPWRFSKSICTADIAPPHPR